MMVLAGHRTEPAHLPEQRLGDLDLAAKVGTHELSGHLGQIEKDSTRFEHRDSYRSPQAGDQQSPECDCWVRSLGTQA
jgi:hypothetical protein